MRVAFYLRVSTAEQNADFQRRELQHYAARHDWQVVDQYEDLASGAQYRRSELARLLTDARRGKFECVLCWALDRLGRTVLGIETLIRQFEEEGVRFIVVSQGIDTGDSNPMADAFRQHLAIFSELERKLIGERTRAGMRRYQSDLEAGRVGVLVHSRSGKDLPPSRPRKVFDVARARELRAAGLPFALIATQVGVSRATLCRRLKVE